MKLWGGVRPTSIPSNGNGRILFLVRALETVYVQGYLANIPVTFLVDTGADVTLSGVMFGKELKAES